MAFNMLLSFMMILLSSAPIRRYFDEPIQETHSTEPVRTIYMCQRRLTDVNFGPNMGTLSESLKRNVPSNTPEKARQRCKQRWRGDSSWKTLPVVILLLSGDISPNPGPRKARYPCGICKYAVGATQRAIQCDNCDYWIHFKCVTGMTVAEYHALGDSDVSWYCSICKTDTTNINNAFDFSDSFFSTTSDRSQNESTNFNFTDSFFNNEESHDTQDYDELQFNISENNSHNDSTDLEEIDDDSQDIVANRLAELKSRHSKNTIVAYLNINSYRYKACDIISVLNRNYIDIMCIAETKLDGTFPSQQFHTENYAMYRRDGPSAQSGGLMAYVSSRLSSRRRTDLEPEDIECIALELISDRKKVFMYMCYRSPSYNICTYLQKLSRSIDTAILETDNITVIGDLNQNMLVMRQCKELCDFADIYNMNNLIDVPTCYKSSVNNSLVDVILTTQKDFYKTSGVIENGYSDVHHMIYGVLKNVNLHKPAKMITYRSFKSFDEEKFNQDLESAPFHVGSVFDDVDDKLWYFHKLYSSIVDDHAPLKSKKIRPTQPAFMNSRLRKNVNRKAQLRNRYNKHPTKRNWEQYRIQRNRTTMIRKQSIKNYLVEKCSGKHDKSFYKTIRPLINTKAVSSYPTQLMEENELANIMNSYFTNIAVHIGEPVNENDLTLSDEEYITKCIDKYQEHESVCKIREKCTDMAQFSFRKVEMKDIEKLFRNIDTSKATGFDLIPSKILKLSANNIVYPVTCLINEMFCTSDFPDMLKCAEIGPVHKKDSLLDKVNYRPLSVLTSLSKLFEKAINHQLQLAGNYIFCESLSAYRQNHSTQHVMIQLIENVKKHLDMKQASGSVLMDLSKAFDCLNHDLTIAKLYAYNFNRDALKLITSYLRNRKQRVKIGNTRSEWQIIKKGVPQGSVVGPTIFNYFINDLFMFEDDFKIANYADDNSIYATAPSRILLLDKLSKATCIAIKWFTSNSLQANPQKFQFIVFGKKVRDEKLMISENVHIECSKIVKLLGVSLDQELNFNAHVKIVCRKAAWQLTALGRISKYLSQEARMTIFRTFIASNLEYCKSIWHFCSKADTRKIEKIQERGLRIVFQDTSSGYEYLLDKSGLKTQEESRLQSILIEVYKALNGLSPLYVSNLFKEKHSNYDLVRKNQLTLVHHRTKAYGLQTFSHQGARMWNALPNSFKDIEQITVFKNSIKKVDMLSLRSQL